MTPTVAEIDDTGDAPIAANPNAMIDTDALDRKQRREIHPFAAFCEQVREHCGIRPSQAAKEVVSDVCNAVAKLTIVEKDTVEEQAEHIAKIISKEREEMGDRQLWSGPASRVAKHALTLRIEGKGVVSDPAAAEAA